MAETHFLIEFLWFNNVFISRTSRFSGFFNPSSEVNYLFEDATSLDINRKMEIIKNESSYLLKQYSYNISYCIRNGKLEI